MKATELWNCDNLSHAQRLSDLLRGPSPGRMLRHIEMQHLSTVVFQQDEYEEHSHGNFGHGKEVDGDQLADMVVLEGPPRLVRWPPEPAQDARHSALGDGDAEHLELAM